MKVTKCNGLHAEEIKNIYPPGIYFLYKLMINSYYPVLNKCLKQFYDKNHLANYNNNSSFR